MVFNFAYRHTHCTGKYTVKSVQTELGKHLVLATESALSCAQQNTTMRTFASQNQNQPTKQERKKEQIQTSTTTTEAV